MPQTHIVVQGLYPRGADFDANKYVWPNNYTYALDLLNSHYRVKQHCRGFELGLTRGQSWPTYHVHVMCLQRITMDDPQMHYVYCGSKFVTPTGDGIAQVRLS